MMRWLTNKSNRVFVMGLPVALMIAVGVLLASARGTWERESVEGASGLKDLSGNFLARETMAWFGGQKVQPLLADKPDVKPVGTKVLGAVTDERWIEVSLSEQKLIAHEGNGVFLEAPVSSGKWAPTPTGEFRVWIKLRYAKMEGGVKGTGTYYYLPNVPYVMYFANDQVPGSRGYSLHGAYWHNNFGHPMSHGCVNLPIPVAEKLYYWASPALPEGARSVRSTADNPGVRIAIHE